MKENLLERADFPEQVGVNSDSFRNWIRYLESINMRADSLMIVRHGKVACECHWAPNSADVPHDMFSLSKTIVALAIGIAVDEGILSLDTRVYEKYFPHKLHGLHGKQLEWAKKLNIHHIISMQVGKVTSVLDNKEKGEWLDNFLDCPFKFEPGTEWKYISENAFLLSWILQKETGMTVTEFLTPRLYEPLGIKVPYWDKDRHGVDAGGWGLMLNAEDMCKLAILYLNKGVYNGKRIFSEAWYNTCTESYIKKTYPVFTDKTGYSYMIWIDHENDDTTYRFTGLYGQFVFIYPDYDAAVIITASDNRDEQFINSTYEFFPKAFIEPRTDCDKEKLRSFKALVESKCIQPHFSDSAVRRNFDMEKRINNRLIKFPPVVNLSTQGATSYFMWCKKIGYMNDVKFDFSEDGLKLSFREKDSEPAVIDIGMDGCYRRNKIILAGHEVIIDAQAAWNRNGTLEVFFYNTGRPQTKRLTFTFGKRFVKVISQSDPGYGDIARFNIEFNMGKRVGVSTARGIRFIVPVFENFYSDPNTIGRFVE